MFWVRPWSTELNTSAGMVTERPKAVQYKANILSQGISEAMYCTAFGLSVAIPALVF